MPDQVAKSKLAEASISAVIIRADGTREELGRIAYYHKSPLRRLAFRVGQKLKRRS